MHAVETMLQIIIILHLSVFVKYPVPVALHVLMPRSSRTEWCRGPSLPSGLPRRNDRSRQHSLWCWAGLAVRCAKRKHLLSLWLLALHPISDQPSHDLRNALSLAGCCLLQSAVKPLVEIYGQPSCAAHACSGSVHLYSMFISLSSSASREHPADQLCLYARGVCIHVWERAWILRRGGCLNHAALAEGSTVRRCCTR